MKITCEKKLAVCILAFNRLGLLKQTIDSVFNSSSDDYQIFILNDNSTDGTSEYLDNLKKEKNIIEIRHKNNIGMGRNANYVIENINAKYCLILHDDDILEKDFIKEMLKLVEKDENIAIAGTGLNTIDGNNNIVETIIYNKYDKAVILDYKEYFYDHVDGLTFPWSGSLIRMDKIKNQRFDFGAHPYCADTVFLNSLIIGNKVGYIPKPLFNSRFHKNQVTKKIQNKNFGSIYKEWVFDFEFYRKIFKENNFGKDIYKKHNLATNRIMLHLIIIAPNFKYYFKFLFSKYFHLFLLSPKNTLRVFYKFFKLLFHFKGD